MWSYFGLQWKQVRYVFQMERNAGISNVSLTSTMAKGGNDSQDHQVIPAEVK